MLTSHDLDVIQKLIDQRTNGVEARVANLQGACGNWAAMSGTAPGNPGAAPVSYAFAALVLNVQVSGFFLVNWAVAWSDNTTADAVTFKLVSNTAFTAGQATGVGQAAATGFAGSNVGGALAGGSAPGAYICAAAGTTMTALIPAGGLTTKTQFSASYPTLTGMLTPNGNTQWAGGMICGNAVNAAQKTPFQKGNNVTFLLEVTATDTIAIPQVSFSALEIPVG